MKYPYMTFENIPWEGFYKTEFKTLKEAKNHAKSLGKEEVYLVKRLAV